MDLVVEKLNKTFIDPLTFKQKKVLFDVSFSIPKGSVTGFLGNNGAGKTTSLKCILGLLRYDSGKVEFFNGQLKDPRVAIGYLPERPYFYDYLTGLEFLLFYGQLSMSLPKKEIKKKALDVLEKVGLARAKDQRLRQFSKGMLQRIGLAQAILHTPQFLILDEPMSGLDPDGRYQMTQIIREIADAGATLFFSSHLLDDVEKLCQRLVIINSGKIIYEGLKNDFLKTKSQGYEIYYLPQNSSQAQCQHVISMVEAENFLSQLQKNNGSLQEIRPVKLTLDEAFNQINQQIVSEN